MSIVYTNPKGGVVEVRAFVSYWLYDHGVAREFHTVAEALRFIEKRSNCTLYRDFKLTTGDFMRSAL